MVESVAHTHAAPPSRYGWMSALGALLAGSIVAFLALFLLELGLSPLHVLPEGYPAEPGAGWPFRIDGTWSALADLGPLLLGAALIAGGVGLYMSSQTGRRTARWPIALCAIVVGWIPVAQSGRAGLLGVGGGLAFLAMWWTTRATADLHRPDLPGARRLRVVLAALLAVALLAVSVSYAALHPVRAAAITTDSGAATLHRGISDRAALDLHNTGPLSVRILGLSLPDAPGLRVARLERDGPRTVGPSIEALFSPFGRPRIAPGDERTVWLTLAGPLDCSGSHWSIAAFDVRLAVAGSTRTQRVALTKPIAVGCRAPHRS